MKIIDFFNSSPVKKIREEIHSFAEDSLRDYINEIRSSIEQFPNVISQKKDIYDAVWGSIELNVGEVLIIDSPIIQRLRRINHLGLASILFPSAEYSRFEHSLGVLYVTDDICAKIISEINHSDNQKKGEERTNYLKQLCRLAAILHDSGHFFYSHVSEKYFESPHFSRNNEIKELMRYFILNTHSASPRFSEIVSCLIVTSPAFQELLELVWPYLKLGPNFSKLHVQYFIGLICSFIIGVPTTFESLPFSRIISGPIDADKCDYLARDSIRTGVPVAVDLYRVIQKIRLIEKTDFSYGFLWDEIPNDKKIYLMGIAFSAVKSVEEIIISRSFMQEKIYYHHKIQTAEEMFRYALRLLEKSGFQNLSNFQHALCISDHDITSNLPKEYLTSWAKNAKLNTNFKEPFFSDACDIIKQLVNRKLLKRACTIFSQGCISTANIGDDPDTLIKDIFTAVDPDKQTEFIKKIKIELETIIKIIHPDVDIKSLNLMTLPVPYPQSLSSGYQIPIEYSGSYLPYSELFQGETWDNSRKTSIILHYITGVSKFKHELYLATEKVLIRDYGILLQNDSYLKVKIKEEDLIKLKHELTSKEYYKDTYEIIPDYSIYKDKKNDLSGLIDKFKPYEGPLGYGINSITQLTSFLKQFVALDIPKGSLDELFSGLIIFLKQIEILNRKKIGESLNKMLLKVASQYGKNILDLNICNIGNLKDGSTHITYYLNDLEQNGIKLNVNTIHMFLGGIFDPKKPIVFIDDAYYSGSQTIAIFQEMCGLPIEKRIIPESHDIKLKYDELDNIKKAKIALCYCFANKEKKQFIEDSLKSLGLTVELFYANSFPSPLFNNTSCYPFESENQKNLVQQALKLVGEQLLKNTKRDKTGTYKNNWDESRIEKSALGYNDAQQCLILPWNTPTYTFTALWLKGELSNKQKWYPLFPRQSKG